MNNMSPALLGQSFDCFLRRVRFVFLVESNVHPINKSAVLAFFRVMSVLEHKPIHALVGHLLYTPVSLVSLPFRVYNSRSAGNE